MYIVTCDVVIVDVSAGEHTQTHLKATLTEPHFVELLKKEFPNSIGIFGEKCI